jgi:hypothetical protein
MHLMVPKGDAFESARRAVGLVCLPECNVVRRLTFEDQVRTFLRRKRVESAHPEHFRPVDQLDWTTFNGIAHGCVNRSTVRFACAPAGYACKASGDYEAPSWQKSAFWSHLDRYFVTTITVRVMNAPRVFRTRVGFVAVAMLIVRVAVTIM